MMLRYSLGLPEQADRIDTAVAKALSDGARSFDLGGTMSTVEMGDAVLAALV
jgi:3-isopropylmalate dehydrogenase